MTSPFDIVKAINSKDALEFDMKDYSPYLINKALTNNIETIFFADMMNRFAHLSNESQYAFYLHGIPKKKRYDKWVKKDEFEVDLLNAICEKYQCNRQLAGRYIVMMSDENKQELLEKSKKGGK